MFGYRAVLGAFCAIWMAPALGDTGYDYTVTPLANGAFEITPARAAGPSVYWCAAADHARTRLQASGSAPLFVLAGATGRAARFSLSPPPGGPVQSFDLSISTPGNSLSVAAALQYCFNVSINE